MPWNKRKKGDKWETYNEETDEVKGTFDTPGEADEQLKALWANTDKAEKVNMVISQSRPVSIIDKDGSWFIVDDDGNTVPGADEPHVSREEAEAHLKAMFQDDKPLDTTGEGELIKYDDDAIGKPKTMFIPLAKVDIQKRQVWGYAGVEEPDAADEIMDYPTSKPHWVKWSEAAFKRSGGKSLGNLRSMHKAIAAGKLIAFQPDDQNLGFWIGAEVVDDDEWKKVMAGVYTGFSVGGDYVRKWRDIRLAKTRYTAKPIEVSLVDAPCMPSATFQVVKADGLTENMEFHPGDGTNILKADLPDSPQAAGTVDGVPDATVEKQPETDKPMQVNPTNPPTGTDLAARHAGVQELDMGVVEPKQETKVTKIKVTRRMIKVFKPEPKLIKVTRKQPKLVKVRR